MELEELRIEEPSVKRRWLWALGASRARVMTPVGATLRFLKPGTLEAPPALSGLPEMLDLKSFAFEAPIHLRARTKFQSGTQLELDDDVDLFSVATRSCRRLRLEAGGGKIVDATDSVLIGAPVVDLGPADLGVAIQPGVGHSHVELELEVDGRKAQATATLIRRPQGGGLRLEDGDGLSLVRQAYQKRRFPHLVDRSAVSRDRVESLAEQSGFLALRPGLSFPRDWASLKLPPILGRDAAYVDASEQLVGIMSATRTGKSAWLVHQLAAEKDHPDVHTGIFALHDFMMTYPRAVGSKDARIMCYFDRAKNRNEIYYDSFERLIGNPDLVGTVPLQRFERPSLEPVPSVPSGPSRLRVRRARPDDDLALCELIRGVLPRLHADALEIFPGHLSTPVVHGEFAHQGLRRGREVFVLADLDRIVAVALCEFGSPELSLFGLFNICHLYRRPQAEVSALDERRLLAQVRQFYKEQSISEPVLTSPPACFEHLREPGTELIETMAWYVWHPDVLPQYENFYRFRFCSHPYIKKAAG